MANRLSLKDRKAQDASGVDAIIHSTHEPTQPQMQETEAHKQTGLSKVTLYIRPDQVLAIEEIQLEERKRTGRRKDKSDLMQEALDLLIEKYGEA